MSITSDVTCYARRRCPIEGICNGNASTCAEGHTGPYCMTCEKGYAKDGDTCVLCEGSRTNTVIIGILAIFAAFIGAFYASIKINKMAASAEGLDINRQQDLVNELEKKLIKTKNKLMKIRVKVSHSERPRRSPSLCLIEVIME